MKARMKVLVISLIALVLMISLFAGIAFAQSGDYSKGNQVTCANCANGLGNCDGLCDGACESNAGGLCYSDGNVGGVSCPGGCGELGEQGNCYRQGRQISSSGTTGCCGRAAY